MSIIPSTTRGFSVKRSSRPKKSPYWEFSPVKVVSPRLWYRLTPLTHAGTFESRSASGTHGWYGKLVKGAGGAEHDGCPVGRSAGKKAPPAKSRSSKDVPAAARCGGRSFAQEGTRRF